MSILSNLLKRDSHSKKKTRVGRGIGSGHGGHTSTRGQKGQKSRSGGKVPMYFEGGQLPLVKRLPHLKGFKNFTKTNVAVVKTSALNKLDEGAYTPAILVQKGTLKNLKADKVKVLSDEKVNKKLELKGFLYSKSAKSTIEKAGGKAK